MSSFITGSDLAQRQHLTLRISNSFQILTAGQYMAVCTRLKHHQSFYVNTTVYHSVCVCFFVFMYVKNYVVVVHVNTI